MYEDTNTPVFVYTSHVTTYKPDLLNEILALSPFTKIVAIIPITSSYLLYDYFLLQKKKDLNYYSKKISTISYFHKCLFFYTLPYHQEITA